MNNFRDMVVSFLVCAVTGLALIYWFVKVTIHVWG